MRPVLLASDFSRASRQAFNAAVGMAKANRTTLIVLHVLEPFLPIGPDQYIGPETWQQLEKQELRSAQKHLRALTDKAKTAGVRATALLVHGTPAQGIVRIARSRRCGTLVLGTHGRTGLARLFLGSVASAIVATAPCPVLTVRGR